MPTTTMFPLLAAVAIHHPNGFVLLLVLLAVAITILLLITTATQHRKHSAQTQTRICKNCGTSHPTFAHFCRRCGGKL